MNDIYKKIDPSMSPDGLCWTVVQTRDGETVCRTRFVNEQDARDYAHKITGLDGCFIHLEGPSFTPALCTPTENKGE